MNESEVLATVEKHLEQHQSEGLQLNVSRQGIRHDGDWWYVVVLPDPPDVRAYRYDQIVSQVEDEIETDDKLKVLLVPAMPD